MAGLIRREDIDAVRERVNLDDIISPHVTLRPAGVGTLKGLCPFHDEKTPSFTVRPQMGRWHCFGCGAGGDAIAFVQELHGMSFVEAVEHLADIAGVHLRYEEGSKRADGAGPGLRRRLLSAHEIAAEFFQAQLLTPAGAVAREFLQQRNFDREAAETFGVGYAPASWDALLTLLRKRGFTEAEITASGLVSAGARGSYDRFRNRLMWPIRDVVGATIGFGARKLAEDDGGPKYLNTPETPIYHKSKVLYGLDLAKRAIAKERRVVIVEGYTDVMAAHLAGVECTVATCGTAFGADHVQVLRRLLGDTKDASAGVVLADGKIRGGEVIFTFDGDAAGRKAALRAFHEDQSFGTQTFVAVEPRGLDPCDLRLQEGDEAISRLLEHKVPLFEFVIRSTLAELDLTTAEGRVAGLRSCAPIIATIRDRALRSEYIRALSGWIGMDHASVARAVARPDHQTPPPVPPRKGAGRGLQIERQALQLALQHPQDSYRNGFDSFSADSFQHPQTRALAEAIIAVGGTGAAHVDGSDQRWRDEVSGKLGDGGEGLVGALTVTPLPVDEAALTHYMIDVFNELVCMQLDREITQLRRRLQQLDETAADYQQIFAALIARETERRQRRG